MLTLSPALGSLRHHECDVTTEVILNFGNYLQVDVTGILQGMVKGFVTEAAITEMWTDSQMEREAKLMLNVRMCICT